MASALESLSQVRPLCMLPADPLVEEVLIPSFQSASSVNCMVGFFSSTILAELAPGLATFVNSSEGTFKLIVCPILSDEDRRAIEDGFAQPSDLAQKVLEHLLITEDRIQEHTLDCLTPNPPKDTDGRREDSGRGVRELQGRWPGLHWGRWEVGGRSSVAAQGSYDRLRELRCAGWRENTQQGTLADWGGASLRGRWVSCRLAVRPGVEWLAAGPRRE